MLGKYTRLTAACSRPLARRGTEVNRGSTDVEPGRPSLRGQLRFLDTTSSRCRRFLSSRNRARRFLAPYTAQHPPASRSCAFLLDIREIDPRQAIYTKRAAAQVRAPLPGCGVSGTCARAHAGDKVSASRHRLRASAPPNSHEPPRMARSEQVTRFVFSLTSQVRTVSLGTCTRRVPPIKARLRGTYSRGPA